MDLDQLLSDAAPQTSARTTRVDVELRALASATEPKQRRRRMRLAVVGGALVGAVGVGAAASAAGLLPGWTTMTTSSGQTCEVSVEAGLLPPGDGEPISSTFSLAEQEAALVAAQSFLERLDYDSIDRDAAIARWRDIETRIRDAEPDPAERQPRLQGDDLEISAVTSVVVDRMRSELAAQGRDIRAISVVGGSTCDL